MDERNNKRAEYYYTAHRVRRLPNLGTGDMVYVADMRRYGTVKERQAEPRSYLIKIGSRDVRRTVYTYTRWIRSRSKIA